MVGKTRKYIHVPFLKLHFRYTFDVVSKDKHTYIKMHRLLTITLNFNIFYSIVCIVII